MRVDSKIYPSGARSLKNTVLYNTGAVARRPGSMYLGNINGRTRLIPFEFDADEKYVCAFQNNRLDIYNPDGTIAQTFTGSTDCPWSTTTMWELTYTQFGNTMIICHETWKPKVLKRTGLSSFNSTDFSFDTDTSGAVTRQPYNKFEAPSVRIKVSSVNTGTGRTITADTAIFSADWVGDRIRIHGKEIEITAYTSTTVVTGTVKKRIEKLLDPNPFRYTDGSGEIEVAQAFHGYTTGDSVTIAGANDDNGVARGNINGSRTITVVDEDHWEFTTGSTDNASDSAVGGGTSVKITAPDVFTRDWDEQAFSDRRGWPGAVCLHQDRLWFGGSTEIPDGMFGSTVGNYYDHDVSEGEDDAAVQVVIAAQRLTKIRHLVSNRGLQIFAEGAEFAVETTDGEPITPGGIRIEQQTSYGSNYVSPVVFDGATIFSQANNKTIREFIYDFSSNAFASPDIGAVSSHLINAPRDMGVLYGSTSRPEQYCFVVNGDGTMAVFHSIRSEQLAAWVPWETRSGDLFDSVCVIGTDIYVSVNRDSTYRLEKMDLDDTDLFLDFCKEMSGSSTVTWALGSAYASRTLDVVSNGNYLGQFTADGSGTITLNDAVTHVMAGYDSGIEIIPMSPDKELYDGPMTGVSRRISSVTVHFHETVNCKIDTFEVLNRQIGADFSIAPVPFTGKQKTHLLNYDTDPVFTITQSAPAPIVVMGCVMEVSL